MTEINTNMKDVYTMPSNRDQTQAIACHTK